MVRKPVMHVIQMAAVVTTLTPDVEAFYWLLANDAKSEDAVAFGTPIARIIVHQSFSAVRTPQMNSCTGLGFDTNGFPGAIPDD